MLSEFLNLRSFEISKNTKGASDMAVKRKKKRRANKRFKLIAGRTILANGEPFIYVARSEGTKIYPTTADDAAKVLVKCLNKSRLKIREHE